VAIRRVCGQVHGLEKALDIELLRLCRPAIENMEPVELSLPIRNVNRTVGKMLGSAVSIRHGLEGLHGNNIRLSFTGSDGELRRFWESRRATLAATRTTTRKGSPAGAWWSFRIRSTLIRENRDRQRRALRRDQRQPSSAAWPASASAWQLRRASGGRGRRRSRL
jgi:hypothetical protein